MPPGLLWVSSRIATPTSPSTNLTPSKFCDWYENTHIQEVTALPGVPRAARYEAVDPQPDVWAWSARAPWLTVYEMPDVDYRKTEEFLGLDGQTRPSEELLNGIFKQARFDTRFYEEVGVEGQVDGPAKYLVSWALQPTSGSEEDFDVWFGGETAGALQKLDGFRRLRRCKVVNATTLDQFVRKEEVVPPYLALLEFEGEELPREQLLDLMQSERSDDGVHDLTDEVGWYRLKRTYLG